MSAERQPPVTKTRSAVHLLLVTALAAGFIWLPNILGWSPRSGILLSIVLTIGAFAALVTNILINARRS
jgi:hypothetical protein